MERGFTLIEAILTLSILAVGFVGVLVLYHQNIAKADLMEQTSIATFLAQAKLEQIIQNKKYQNYASISAANYPAEDLSSIGFPGFTRTTTVTEVQETNLTTAQNGSGYKRVAVSVQRAGTSTVKLETLVTLWGEIL